MSYIELGPLFNLPYELPSNYQMGQLPPNYYMGQLPPNYYMGQPPPNYYMGQLPPNYYLGQPLQLQTNGFGPIQKTIHSPNSEATPPIVANAFVKWTETPAAHVYKAQMPWLKHKQVKVELENGRELCIVGKELVERVDKDVWGNPVKSVTGRLVQSLKLPTNANVFGIKAYMDSG